MNGIKKSNCKFYVDKDARVVVCVIPQTSSLLLDFIHEHFMFSDVDFYYSVEPKLDMKLAMPNSFIGKAVCSEDDEWDEEYGKTLAYARARDKCYKSFFKRANLFVQTVDGRLGDMITTFNDFGLTLETKREALENELESRTKKEGDA